MSGTVHIFDFQKSPPAEVEGGVVALFGADRFLKLLAVESVVATYSTDRELGATRFAGESVEWADVMDELCTRSLFGGDGPRVVVIDNADAFVKSHRDRIENLVQAVPDGNMLVLVVDKWASNTRLYKSLDKKSLQIQCEAPVIKRGRGKQRDEKKLFAWVENRAKKHHGFKLPPQAAAMLVEVTRCEFGHLDQELAKLALYVDEENPDLSLETIRQVAGGWSAATMWSAIDAAVTGDSANALKLLNQLLSTGQHPLALFGQMSWSLRRYAEAAEITARQQRNGIRVNLNDALKEAGFHAWGGEIEKAGSALRQLGRKRAFAMYGKLVDADRALKGSHSRDDRARLVLEILFAEMSRELSPAS